MRYSTKEASLPISKLQGFTTNGAIRGEWLNPERTIYGVFSYQTLMVAVFRETGKALVNRMRYSVTTSKHQSVIGLGIARAELQEVKSVSDEELKSALSETNANARAYEWSTPIGAHKN